MATAHPKLKLGKARAKNDERDLRYRVVVPLKAASEVPKAYDFDANHYFFGRIPLPMFCNDELGDCVIAGRAHQTLRFELVEQSRMLAITDDEVKTEYFAETGGEDNGLVVSDSLNAWRRKGWKAGGGRYSIFGYARVDPTKSAEVRQAIFAHAGIALGLQLPLSAQGQFDTGKPWSITMGKPARKGSWGGHYVYCCGYTPVGPMCITWGKKQQMTWAWLAKYADEAFAIFDAKNAPAKVRAFVEKLKKDAKPGGGGFKSNAQREHCRKLVAAGSMSQEQFDRYEADTPADIPERIHPKE